eukprot:GHRR01024473.1.p2 GENE.GHRR01024473.1~~GHRR01024473.1.p2  ORF type:complete len:134 (+),score=44.46 GHRR01024473.1:124-525(+)
MSLAGHQQLFSSNWLHTHCNPWLQASHACPGLRHRTHYDRWLPGKVAAAAVQPSAAGQAGTPQQPEKLPMQQRILNSVLNISNVPYRRAVTKQILMLMGHRNECVLLLQQHSLWRVVQVQLLPWPYPMQYSHV